MANEHTEYLANIKNAIQLMKIHQLDLKKSEDVATEANETEENIEHEIFESPISQNNHLLNLDYKNSDQKQNQLASDLVTTAKILEEYFYSRIIKSKNEDEEIFSQPSGSDISKVALNTSIRDWISETFTRHSDRLLKQKNRLRILGLTIQAGIRMDLIYRRSSINKDLPPFVNNEKITKLLQNEFYKWDMDIFELNDTCSGQPLKIVAFEVLGRLNMIRRFNINPWVLRRFLDILENRLTMYNNPYHNNVHTAEVLQSCYSLFAMNNLNWVFCELELFALFFSAMIHDFNHSGTTNTFHENTSSELALLYNDRSIMEQHHISLAYRLLINNEGSNILSNLPPEDYREFRFLTIEMVMKTDMSVHFNQLQNMRDCMVLFDKMSKIDMLAFILHACDISHPVKPWPIHFKWSSKICEEFFRQGDLERSQNQPISPLCDRNSVLLPESQIGFIDFVVAPCFEILAEIIKKLIKMKNEKTYLSNSTGNSDSDSSSEKMAKNEKAFESQNIWKNYLVKNREIWLNFAENK